MPPRGRGSSGNSLLWSTLGLCFAAAAAASWVSLLSLQEELRREKLELEKQLAQIRLRPKKSVAEVVEELDLKTLDDRELNVLSRCLSQKSSAITVEATQRAIAQKEKEDTLCVICLAQEKTHMFLPCSHRCTCEPCARQVLFRTKRCPLCRTQTQSIIRVFV
jgi:Zinc finger, C3HC4 type (RING finger)